MNGLATMCDTLPTETITTLQWRTVHQILQKPGSFLTVT